MDINLEFAKPVTLCIIDRQTLFAECLAAALIRSGRFTLLGVSPRLEPSLLWAADSHPDLLLLAIDPGSGFFEALPELAQRVRTTKLLLLDERPIEAHARQAAVLELAGYLTKTQTFKQIESALCDAHRGMRVFKHCVSWENLTAPGSIRLLTTSLPHPLAKLTPRELDVMVHLAQGYTVKQSGRLLGISPSTVDNHKSRLMRKLQVHKTVDLARLAMTHRLVHGDSPLSEDREAAAQLQISRVAAGVLQGEASACPFRH